jgi:hypothetical protein
MQLYLFHRINKTKPMIRIFLLSFALFLFSFSLNAQDIYRVKADKLNVRASAEAKSKIIGFIPQGENVVVLDSTNAKYFKVKVTNAEGWVASEFLTKISSAPKPAQAKSPAVVAAPKAAKDYSGYVFLGIVIVIFAIILFFILKYAKENKVLIGFATVIILITGYFCYITFFEEKIVLGTFASDSDTQYQSFDFKNNDSVVVKDIYADSTFTAKYIIEGDIIKLYDQQNMILLLIRDNQTLIGEGFTRGTFRKK